MAPRFVVVAVDICSKDKLCETDVACKFDNKEMGKMD